jgi:hypothetical protein
LGDLAWRVALADLLVLEGRQLSKASAAREERDQEVDDDRAEAEATASQREPAAAHAAAADIGYLARIEPGSPPEAHAHPYQHLPPAKRRSAGRG